MFSLQFAQLFFDFFYGRISSALNHKALPENYFFVSAACRLQEDFPTRRITRGK
jgi:hypothetical protein